MTSRPFHVALVYWDAFTGGGVQSQVAGRLDSLGAPGGAVRYTLFSGHVPAANPWPHVRVEEISGWPHLSIALLELTGALSLVSALKRVHSEDPFDLVELHAIGAGPLVIRWARRVAVPVLAVCHSLRFHSIKDHGHRWETALFYRWANRRTFQGATGVVAVSRSVRDELVRFGAIPERISVVYPAVHPAPVTGPAELPARDSLEVAFVGRTSREKGLEVLLRAVRIADGESVSRRIHLNVVGAVSPGSPLRKAAAVERAPVTFLGPLENTASRRVMAEAEVVVVPSLYEPFGLVCVEALLAGALVVASGVGGLAEILDDGRTGILVPPGDAKTLARVLLDVAERPEAFSEIRRRAVCAGLSHTWEARAPELLELYRRVLGR